MSRLRSARRSRFPTRPIATELVEARRWTRGLRIDPAATSAAGEFPTAAGDRIPGTGDPDPGNCYNDDGSSGDDE